MTREQAKEKYGEGTRGYVNCWHCPLGKHDGEGAYHVMCPEQKDGLIHCWDAIAKFKTEEDFTGCNRCAYEKVSMFDEPCKGCKHNIVPTDPEYDTTQSNYIPKEDVKEDLVKHDTVNHPSHYTTGMECIDEMVLVFGEATVADFCLCNVWKYRKRALHKNGQEDLDKADWYMNKFKELVNKPIKGMGVDEYVREKTGCTNL